MPRASSSASPSAACAICWRRGCPSSRSASGVCSPPTTSRRGSASRPHVHPLPPQRFAALVGLVHRRRSSISIQPWHGRRGRRPDQGRRRSPQGADRPHHRREGRDRSRPRRRALLDGGRALPELGRDHAPSGQAAAAPGRPQDPDLGDRRSRGVGLRRPPARREGAARQEPAQGPRLDRHGPAGQQRHGEPRGRAAAPHRQQVRQHGMGLRHRCGSTGSVICSRNRTATRAG